MGCDGGTIPKRDEMVKLKKKAEKVEKAIELAAKWRHCTLSSERLQQPVVACELGRLYNKESVLMTLLDKSSIPEIAKHLRSLKDVIQLQLTPNPDYRPSEKVDDLQVGEFICPVTGIQMTGQHRFIFFRQCGCVISEKAIKEAPSSVCHKCGKPFVKEDITVINGTDEELDSQRKAMEERRQAVRLAKRKRKAETTESSSCSSNGDTSTTIIQSSDSMETTTPSVSTPTISVIKEEPVEKKSKLVVSGSSKPVKPKIVKKSIATTKSQTPSDTKGLKKRDAYKSLFTSSVPARPKERTSNWVTFFPYH